MRLFVAIPLPEEITLRLEQLASGLKRDGVNPVSNENMHITLRFLGEVEHGKEKEIEERLHKIRFEKFSCTFIGVGVFPSKEYVRVVWVGAESNGALEGLTKKVNNELKEFGKEEENFVGHITIARVKRKVDFSSFLEKYTKAEFGSFEVSSFTLVQSRLEPEGVKYEKLAAFYLA
ncbi:RNA 2',3'-cyclic phosphodiesterase [Candidatus Micrarchaeota archaeon]|nr:RNA 2',3'-cyclic phosphodiesterase [Candidatus Micrarchaeota archaeon]